MTHVKCIRCGVINLVSSEVCEVCGFELDPTLAHITHPEPESESNSTTVISIRPFESVGDVLGPGISLFFKNIWLITKIVVVIVVPFEAFRVLKLQTITTNWELVVAFGLKIFCSVLIAPALIYALMKVMQTGVAPGINESYRWSVGKIGRLAVCAALAWILQALGIIALIVPGIILMLAFEVVYPVAVLENLSPKETLRRSSDLTRGRRWNILGAVFLMWLLASLLTMAARLPTFLVFGGASGAFWPLQVLFAVFTEIIGQTSTVLSLVIYLSILRALERGDSVIQ